MISIEKTYTDYNGVERTEEFNFNLTQAEIMEMEMGTTGGLTTQLRKIIASNDQTELVKYFKKLILDSYGEKSQDGKRFVKSEEISKAFSQTEAYSQIFMELALDTEAATKFVNGIVPSDMAEKAKQLENSQNVLPMPTDK